MWKTRRESACATAQRCPGTLLAKVRRAAESDVCEHTWWCSLGWRYCEFAGGELLFSAASLGISLPDAST
jgi:hypothetical protein